MPTSVAQIASASIKVTADTGSATRDLRGVRTALGEVGTAGQQAQGRLAGLKSAFGGLASGLGTLGLASMGLQAVVGAAQGASEALGVNFNASMEQARKGFSNLLGGEQAANAELAKLQTLANNTNLTFPDLVKGERAFLNLGKTADAARQELIDVGNAVAAAGGGRAELDGIVLALTQIASKGKVSAEEINQINERGIPGWRILADALHTTTGEVQAMAAAGQISSDVFEQAFHQFAAAHWGDAMADQARTMNGALGTVQDNVQQVVATGFKPLFDVLSQGAQDTAAFVSSADFQTWGTNTATVVQTVLQVLGGLTGFVSANFVPILTGAAVVTVPLLVSAMTTVITTAPAMAAALWAATGPIGVLAVGAAALAIGWQNDFLGMRTATEGLLQPVMDLQQQMSVLTGEAQSQAAGMAAVQAAWAAHGPITRDAAEAAALLAEQTHNAGGEMQVAAAMAANQTAQLHALSQATGETSDKILDQQRQFVTRLGAILAETGPDARSAAAGIADAFDLLREQVPPGMEQVANDIRAYLETAKTGGTAEAQALNTQVTAELQALTENADASTAATAQAILDHWADVLENTPPIAASTGTAYIDELVGNVTAGMPAFAAILTSILRTADQQEQMALIGGAMGRRFRIELLAQMSQALQTAATRLSEAMEGADNSATVGMRKLADKYAQTAVQLAKDEGIVGAHIGKTIEVVNAEAVAAEAAATRHAKAGAKKTAASASHAAAAQKHAEAVAKAAEREATAQEKSAESIIKELGKAALTTTDSSKTIAQAYDDLLPILTAKLPAGLKWLQDDYKALLDDMTSSTPPSLAQVHAQFDTWLAKLRDSNNTGWRLLAQAQIDAVTQAEQKTKETLDKEQQDFQQTFDNMVAEAFRAAAELKRAQAQAASGLAGILQTAAKPDNNFGALIIQMLDLAQQATDAKMPQIADTLTRYAQQIADGSRPPLQDLDATFQAMLDQMAASGDLRLRAIALSFRETWAQILADQHAAAVAAAADQKRWQDETSALMQKTIDDANAKRIADAQALKQAQDQALADTLAWLQKMQQASVGLAGGLGGVGKSLFDASSLTKPGGILAIFSSLGPLIQQALDAGMPAVADRLRSWMEQAARGGTVPIQEMVDQIRAALDSLAQSADPLVALMAQQAIAELNAAQAAAQYTAAIQAQNAAIAGTQQAIKDAQAAGQQIAKAQADQQAVVQGLTEKYQALQAEYQKWTQAQLAGTQAQNAQQAVLKQQQGIVGLALGDLQAAGGDTGAALAKFQQEYAQIKATQDQAVQALQAQIAGASGDQKTTLEAQLQQLLAVQGGQQGAIQQVMDALAGGGGADALQKILDALSGQSSNLQSIAGLTTDPLKDIISGIANPVQEFDFSTILGGLTDTSNQMAVLNPQIDAAKKQLDALGQAAADNQVYIQTLNDQLGLQQTALSNLQAAQAAAAQGYATLGTSIQTTTSTALAPLPGVMDATLAGLSAAFDPHLDPSNEQGILGKWATTPKSLLSIMYQRLQGDDNSNALRPNVRLATAGMMTDMGNAIDDAMPGVTDSFGAGMVLMGDTAETQVQRVKNAIQSLNGMSVTISVSTDTGPPQQSGPPLGTNAQTTQSPFSTHALMVPLAGGKGGAGATAASGPVYQNCLFIDGDLVAQNDPDIPLLLAKIQKYTSKKNAGALA